MEAKEKWKDYTETEKKDLLIHWFKYVEKDNYTPEDLERFEILTETRPDEVFDYIVNLWYSNGTWRLNELVKIMYFGDYIINAFFRNTLIKDNLDTSTIELLDELREDMIDNLVYYGNLVSKSSESGGITTEGQSGPRLKG